MHLKELRKGRKQNRLTLLEKKTTKTKTKQAGQEPFIGLRLRILGMPIYETKGVNANESKARKGEPQIFLSLSSNLRMQFLQGEKIKFQMEKQILGFCYHFIL